MRVLVVTAVAEEADAVLAGLRGRGGVGEPVATAVGPYGEAWTVPLPWGEAVLLVGGVGPSAAAAATGTALALLDVDLVVDAGVSGGFPPRATADTLVVADRVVAADLGAEAGAPGTGGAEGPGRFDGGDGADGGDAGDGADGGDQAVADGFLPLDDMGFGSTVHTLDPDLVGRTAAVLEQECGPVLVGTVLTVSTVTGTPATRRRLQRRHPGAAAEAMEGFAVVTAAVAHGVPAVELRTVSNPVGVSDRAQWDLPGAFALLGSATSALLARVPDVLDGTAAR